MLFLGKLIRLANYSSSRVRRSDHPYNPKPTPRSARPRFWNRRPVALDPPVRSTPVTGMRMGVSGLPVGIGTGVFGGDEVGGTEVGGGWVAVGGS